MGDEFDDDPTFDEQERLRYLASFQKQLVSEGSENFLADYKRWFELNRERLAAKYEEIAAQMPKHCAPAGNPVLEHRDRLPFDSVFTTEIFKPILERSLAAAERLGYAVERPVVLAYSPGLEPTATVLPSQDVHTLFVGHGTASFCNYWAKVFSAVIHSVGMLQLKGRNQQAVMEAIRTNSIIIPAVKLVLRYAYMESLWGFGELKQDANLLNFCGEIGSAMETFVVGHEIAHFFFHERFPDSNGEPPSMSPQELELSCDLIGFSICSVVGETQGNFSGKNLIGPLLFFCALRLCEDGQDILLERQRPASDTHPPTRDRIRQLMTFASRADPSGRLLECLKETLNYALILSLYVKSILISAREAGSE